MNAKIRIWTGRLLYPIGHAYTVLKAVYFRGKRFLKIRNPWGNSEWTGRWSDGSREWTAEWLDALNPLEHSFGDDGVFIMEYEDFLETWDVIERTQIFDESWCVSSCWVDVKRTEKETTRAWGFGDVSCMFLIMSWLPLLIYWLPTFSPNFPSSPFRNRHCPITIR